MLTTLGFTIERGGGEEDRGQYEQQAEILGAKGAAMIIKRKVLDEIGLFDPDYFFLREETDLCWRIWLAGYKVIYVPKSVVYHAVGGIFKSEAGRLGAQSKMQLFYWYRNQLMNLLKNLELKNLARIVPPYLFLAFGDSLIRSLRSKDIFPFACLVRAVTWVLKNLKRVWSRRLWINRSVRKRKDEEILPHIMLKTTILDKLRERSRIAALST